MKLNKIVKHIREAIALSQEEFAAQIGVARLAVTRWENDKVIPNRMAQSRIYELTKDKGIDIFEYMLQNMPAHRTQNNIVTLYHGSKSGIIGDIAPISRDRCDFGKGFYMGNAIHQPLTLICSHPESVLYVAGLDLTGLNIKHVPTNIEWAMLVAYSRGKLENITDTALYKKYSEMLQGYDIAVGSIADDRMFYVLDRFFDGAITDKGLVESLVALQLGEQYVALTEKACRKIKIIQGEKLSEIERLCLADISERNRKQGVETANEICRTHRREGRFFDEILKEGK